MPLGAIIPGIGIAYGVMKAGRLRRSRARASRSRYLGSISATLEFRRCCQVSAPAADHDTDKEGNSERLQGRLSRPESQAIQRRAGLSPRLYCVGNGLGRCFDRFRGGSDGVFRPVEFVRAVVRMRWLAFADHQISPVALETNGGMLVWFLVPRQAPTTRRERLGFGRVGSLRGPASESPSKGFGR